MKILQKAVLLVLVLFGCENSKNYEKETKPTDLVKAKFSRNIVEFEKSVLNLKDLVESGAVSEEIKTAFLAARVEYKKVEFLTEYYFPTTAKSINGPALDEVKEDDPLKIVILPEGFQVIEEYLFPEFNEENKEELLKAVKILVSNVGRLKKVNQTTEFTDTHIFDAINLQLFRIVSLGISGFDSPIANLSIIEAHSSLEALKVHLMFYATPGKNPETLENAFIETLKFLNDSSTFNSFNRFLFIRDHLNPLSKGVHEFQKTLGVPFPTELRAFSPVASTPFDSGAFNVNFFAPGQDSYISGPKVQLGKVLFYDPVLSGNTKRSCASCHSPEKGFADGLEKSTAFNFKGKVRRNAPTIINAGLQSALFHDTRVMFLEDQATDVLNNEEEMHGSMEQAANTLKLSDDYIQLFKTAFPTNEDAVTEKNIKIALASFTRSLTGLNSRFDKAIRDSNEQITPEEIRGFNLFSGKAKCATCHFTPLFNGVVPPNFENTEAEVIGVPERNDSVNARVDSDEGKYFLHNIDKHKFAFKTPTVRNIDLTAPYMHNGVFQTLEEVVDFYNRGGGKGIGIDLPNQTLPEDKLNLTPQEKKDLVAFMKSLTDTANFSIKPVNLPRFPNDKLNKRILGGSY